jgi:hypothetical protein
LRAFAIGGKTAIMLTISEEMVLAREAELLDLAREVQAELADLAASKRVFARMGGAKSAVPAEQTNGTKAAITVRANGLGATLIDVLREVQRPWMTAKEVQAAASARMGRDIPMSSISPKLTDLKIKGVVVRDDMQIALAERVQSGETPS